MLRFPDNAPILGFSAKNVNRFAPLLRPFSSDIRAFSKSYKMPEPRERIRRYVCTKRGPHGAARKQKTNREALDWFVKRLVLFSDSPSAFLLLQTHFPFPGRLSDGNGQAPSSTCTNGFEAEAFSFIFRKRNTPFPKPVPPLSLTAAVLAERPLPAR